MSASFIGFMVIHKERYQPVNGGGTSFDDKARKTKLETNPKSE
jgi:hypothetical protein